jgi:hypothetical protein
MDAIAVLNVGTAIFALGLFAELLFDFDYGLTAPWYRSWIGWMFMLNGAAVASAGVAILLGRVLGPAYPARPYVTLVAYSIFAASTIVRYGVFLAERRRPSPRLPVPYFDRPLDRQEARTVRRDRRALAKAERRALKHKG